MFDKTRRKGIKQVQKLIFSLYNDKLTEKGGLIMDNGKKIKGKSKSRKASTPDRTAESIYTGDKKLNGPNRPSV